ncbi:hypothetical protein VHEMI01237 [[Torrubiella] hemipterigena]|uniref:Uncharacterized protein n=1 Tax=[Torrubiella] hemipterigena TaxID=1531966 RepID=A0A0A1T6X7_9HYPO|nr:hypothetical protein VHEMI01237 [[Torrubiella] hemipterigena]
MRQPNEYKSARAAVNFRLFSFFTISELFIDISIHFITLTKVDNSSTMQYSVLTPILLLASAQLGVAQNARAATFISTRGTFDVVGGVCTNFRPTQPIYVSMDVKETYTCALFDNRKCEGAGTGFLEGLHEIEELTFKSVACFLASV